jgi:CBS domain-containing protein
MKVRDLMTKTVVCCRPEMSLAEAGALMWENDCGVLPIVSDTGKLTGVITDRDICIALSTRNAQSSRITTGEVVKMQTFVCSPEDDVHNALRTMRKERIRRLPVVNEEGGLVGILSMNDVVLHAEKGDGKKKPAIAYDDVVHAFQAICAHGPGVHAAAA